MRTGSRFLLALALLLTACAPAPERPAPALEPSLPAPALGARRFLERCFRDGEELDFSRLRPRDTVGYILERLRPNPRSARGRGFPLRILHTRPGNAEIFNAQRAAIRRAQQYIYIQNAYLTDDNSGSGWACERGFTARSGACIPIAVPENGYLTNADYGDAWACERGFFEIDGRCDPVALPTNAFMDPASYGPGWRCERGYEPENNTCVAIDLPANAHLDRSGNRWSCDRGFQLMDGECVLGR